MRKALGGLVILALASAASADPTITWTLDYHEGSIYGFTFTAHANDGLALSLFANATFTGADGGVIQQISVVRAGKPDNPVDCEDEADTWDGLYGYEKVKDSWFGNPFALSPPASIMVLSGVLPGDPAYHIEAGTGGGSHYDDAKLAYIACTGNVSYTAVIYREGRTPPTINGKALIPEPATLLLLVAGAGLAIRRKR
jgi:hypothetical protein